MTHGLKRQQLIINADDFGRDESCTAAIANSLIDGAITATSIMANGSHFDYACELARSSGFADRIGVHLSLDEGPALSQEMRPFLNRRGHLCVPRGLRYLGPALSRAVEAELAKQIERVVAAGTHLDSHRHIHTSFPIGRLVVRLARTNRIPYVRPARNLAARRNILSNAYKWAFNRYLGARVRTADRFGDILDFYRRPAEHRVHGLIECMIHLDDTSRGLEQRRLLQEDGFRRFVGQFQLIGHVDATR